MAANQAPAHQASTRKHFIEQSKSHDCLIQELRGTTLLEPGRRIRKSGENQLMTTDELPTVKRILPRLGVGKLSVRSQIDFFFFFLVSWALQSLSRLLNSAVVFQ